MQTLLDAFSEKETGNRPFELVPYQFLRADREHIVNIDGKWQYHPECLCELDNLIKATQPRILVSMLQGEQAILAGLIDPEKPFEFYLPGETSEFDDSSDVIPFDLLLECCKEHHSLVPPLLNYLRPAITVPTYALSFPPPICDSEFVFAHTGEIRGNRQLPTARWRCRIWIAHNLVLEAIYHENGIPFIKPPPECHDQNYCLRQPFWGDAVHANAQYGHLLLLQLKDLMVERG